MSCVDYEVDDEFVAASVSGAKIVFHPSAPRLYGPWKIDDELWQNGFDWWCTSFIERRDHRARKLGINIAYAARQVQRSMKTSPDGLLSSDLMTRSSLNCPTGEQLRSSSRFSREHSGRHLEQRRSERHVESWPRQDLLEEPNELFRFVISYRFWWLQSVHRRSDRSL